MPTGDYQQLSNFYSILKAKLKPYRDAKQHLDRFLSTDFNVFKWIDPNENRLSDIIADLLNLSGSHGQQRKFLDAFLDAIERSDLKDKQLQKVGREVRTDHNNENPNRRIDIVVESENNDFGLGIENKKPEPGGGDLRDQLRDYYHHLKNKYGEDRFCLVYLTPGGGDPDKDSIEPDLREKLKKEKKLICISYSRHIREWIEECCGLCESDKFRWFLQDFRDHINGGQTMSIQNETEIILAHAFESEENLKTALDINSAFNGDLESQIIVGFLDKFEEFVLDKLRQQRPDASWEVTDDGLRHYPLKKHTDFSFGKRSWGKQYRVALEPDKDNARDVTIGVWRQEDAPRFQPENLLKQALDGTIRQGNNNDTGWEWFHRLDDPCRDWGTKDGLIRLKLHKNEAVKHIGQELIRIIKVAAPIIDAHVRGASSCKGGTKVFR